MDVAVNAILRSNNGRRYSIGRRNECYRFAAGRAKLASGAKRGTAAVAIHDTLLSARYARQRPKVPRGEKKQNSRHGNGIGDVPVLASAFVESWIQKAEELIASPTR